MVEELVPVSEAVEALADAVTTAVLKASPEVDAKVFRGALIRELWLGTADIISLARVGAVLSDEDCEYAASAAEHAFTEEREVAA